MAITPTPATAQGDFVQRQATPEEEEEELQGDFVQRQEEPVEEEGEQA
jgi:hypothetical protein